MSHGLPAIAGWQIVPAGRGLAPGQPGATPLQVPGEEHEPGVAPPQTTPFDTSASVGHAASAPVHDSGRSHAPAAARHTVVRNVGTHAADVPEQ
jgi:hypothetical protein